MAQIIPWNHCIRIQNNSSVCKSFQKTLKLAFVHFHKQKSCLGTKKSQDFAKSLLETTYGQKYAKNPNSTHIICKAQKILISNVLKNPKISYFSQKSLQIMYPYFRIPISLFNKQNVYHWEFENVISVTH